MNRLFFFVALVFLFRAVCFTVADMGRIPPDISFVIQVSEWGSFLTIVALWWVYHETIGQRKG